MRHLAPILGTVVLVAAPAVARDLARQPFSAGRLARNVVVLVPDGMGLADVTAARIHKNGPGGEPLALETLDHVGYQRTWSADSTVTDSAAAASAWACGEKFANGAVCRRPDGSHPSSLLEIARDGGRRTGLVATSTITHATPAAFGAHVGRRDCETEIARQYVEVTGVDVVLGGGLDAFRSPAPDPCGTMGDYVARAADLGYRTVDDRDGLDDAVADGAGRVLGLFAGGSLSPAASWTPSSPEPSLPQMTAAALDLLDDGPGGFFLVVEGSQIDWSNHANDVHGQIAELLAFDDAVRVVLDWIAAAPPRARDTLVVIAPDHETGGFAVAGPYGRLLGAGEAVAAGWTGGNHTGGDVPIWSRGPGALRLARPIDNTDVYAVIRDALR